MSRTDRDYYREQIIKTIDRIESYEAMAKIHAVAKTHLKIQEDGKNAKTQDKGRIYNCYNQNS